MGVREWRLRSASVPLAEAEPAVNEAQAMVWLWPSAASHGQLPQLLVLWGSDSAPSYAESLVRDVARHLGVALPGQPQAGSQATAAQQTLVFGDVPPPKEAIVLPSLAQLASADVVCRCQAWRALSAAIRGSALE
jgi:hypothetical protein